MNNTFIWNDLSTFDLHLAKHFYKQCFGWEYQAVETDYISGLAQGRPSAGLYTMPQIFQNIGLPSFWMPYVRVESIDETINKVERYSARVEIKPQPAPNGGLIALIRDPSGAGFTCFEGDNSEVLNQSDQHGCVVWNELHVSNLDKVASFYTAVFGWHIEATEVKDCYDIFTSQDRSTPIAGIQVISNDVKGDNEYWSAYFLVDNLTSAAKTIEQNGGKIAAEQSLGSRSALLAYDSQDAAFWICDSGSWDSFFELLDTIDVPDDFMLYRDNDVPQANKT